MLFLAALERPHSSPIYRGIAEDDRPPDRTRRTPAPPPEKAVKPMLLGPVPVQSSSWTSADARRLRAFAPEPRQTPRGRHAHLLEIAAARRKRSAQRAGEHRAEDAGYWKAVAPTAVYRAAELRADESFPPLPH
jgi:hypothetical protein